MSDKEIVQFFKYLNQNETLYSMLEYVSNDCHRNFVNMTIDKILSVFPVNLIVLLPRKANFQSQITESEKIKIIQGSFELLFNYAKNLLLKFEIYSKRNLKKTFPQIAECLSKLPNYDKYLQLIGYQYFSSQQEWQLTIDRITRPVEEVLAAMTVASCVGYLYFEDILKVLPLSVFAQQRAELENLALNNDCNLCDNQLDETNLQCRVCSNSLLEMSIYTEWWAEQPQRLTSSHADIFDIPATDFHNNNPQNTMFFDTSPFNVHDRLCSAPSILTSRNVPTTTTVRNIETLTSTSMWTCSQCSFRNLANNMNCLTCLALRQDPISPMAVVLNTQTQTELSNYTEISDAESLANHSELKYNQSSNYQSDWDSKNLSIKSDDHNGVCEKQNSNKTINKCASINSSKSRCESYQNSGQLSQEQLIDRNLSEDSLPEDREINCNHCSLFRCSII